MHASLMGYTAAVVEELDAVAVGPVAADIEAVAHLVSDEGSLGANLTDFGVPTAARRAVLEDLLSSRVQPAALRLVLWAVGSSRADELNTTLHELFELVLHLHELGADELRAEEPALSRTGQRNFAAGYAQAVFEELAGPGDLEEIEDELFRLARIVESQPALRSALSDPSRPAGQRAQLLEELVGGKVEPTTLRLAVMSLRGRLRDLVGALDWLAEQAARARGWRVARVASARPIDDDEQSAMADALQRVTGKPVELQISEDPTLIAGAVIEIGDLLVDATMRRRFEQLQENLLGPEEATRGAHI